MASLSRNMKKNPVATTMLLVGGGAALLGWLAVRSTYITGNEEDPYLPSAKWLNSHKEFMNYVPSKLMPAAINHFNDAVAILSTPRDKLTSEVVGGMFELVIELKVFIIANCKIPFGALLKHPSWKPLGAPDPSWFAEYSPMLPENLDFVVEAAIVYQALPCYETHQSLLKWLKQLYDDSKGKYAGLKAFIDSMQAQSEQVVATYGTVTKEALASSVRDRYLKHWRP